MRGARGVLACAAIAMTVICTSATLVAAPAPASAAAALVKGADVASYQYPGGSGVNWDAYVRAGQSFVFIKATEGLNCANPYLAGDWVGSAAAGLEHAAYHYARPALPLSSATSQARFFVRTVHASRVPGQLPPVLDLEESGGLTPRQLVSWTGRWLTAVHRLTGSAPMIYSYPYFWRTAMGNTTVFTRYPPWIASYGRRTPDMFGGWRRYTFWQYDAFGSAGGINGNGSVDLNRFNGTLADLQRLGGGAVYPVHPNLRGYWTSTGGPNGVGPATAPATAIGDGLGQNFSRATAFSTSTGPRVISGPIRDRYVALNGPSSLGLPTAGVAGVPGATGGQVVAFQNGPIYWSRATGAHAVTGPFLSHYQLLGGPVALGLPTADVAPLPGTVPATVPATVGAQVEVFRGGRIYWSPATPASALTGAILSRYVGLGEQGGALGLPTTDVAGVAGVAGGQMATFQNGRMCWSAASGAHVVGGPILDHYLAVGGPVGFGLPTTDVAAVAAVAGAQVAAFKGGRVYWSAATGAFALSGTILSRRPRSRTGESITHPRPAHVCSADRSSTTT